NARGRNHAAIRWCISFGFQYILDCQLLWELYGFRLQPSQTNIESFISAIFFSAAFMSLTAISYIPTFLEDLATFHSDHGTGFYGPFLFLIANTLISVPFLFGMSMLYSVPIYWVANFQPTATAFFRWVIWLFLDLFAAESLVILICSVWNKFRGSLIATIIANGLWICVGCILIPPYKLNVFLALFIPSF
ncbi:MAG: hypothetical protein FE78DRAFT_539801, partial [Acidomyces sp. 'richmondensis']